MRWLPIFLLLGATATPQSFTNCVYKTQSSNYAGYMSMTKTFTCAEGDITLAGQWGAEIQHGHQYHIELGEMLIDFGGYSPDINYNPPLWGEWQKTPMGYKLIGDSKPQVRE